MFKVILADDEPVIIRGLKKMMDWKKLNAQIVGEAENGEELLNLIHVKNPDIIISDIAMPRKTGIDVLREIKENGWNMKVIFLSGYQEFDYARQAITYGAVDYLLKPVGQAELEQVIQKAEQLFLNKDPMELLQREKDDIQEVFRKINSEYEYTDLYRHFRDMGLETERKVFTGVCFSLSAETVRKIGDQNMLELLRFSVFKKIQEYLKSNKNGFVIKREPNSSNVMLLHGDTELSHGYDIIKSICKKIEEDYKVNLVVGVGISVKNISELKHAYKTAKFSADFYYFCRQNIIRYDKISKEFRNSFEDYHECYKEFLQSILRNDDSWKDNLKNLLSIVESLHYGNRYAAENRCIAMAMDLYKDLEDYGLTSKENAAEYEQFVAHIRGQSTYEELSRFILRYLSGMLNKEVLFKDTADKNTILKVKRYIQEHCNKELSLNSIAKMVYMNPYYFSTFFKKETGQNFKSYVTDVRMKKAMRLLLETDIKTYELSEKVGYHDVRNFAEKFKEYYGDTPSTYRKGKK